MQLFYTLLTIFLIVAGILLVLWLVGLRIVPNNKIAIIEKWWSRKGSLDMQIIALNGEAGYQPQVIRGGVIFCPVDA